MTPENRRNVEDLLYMWSDWMHSEESISRGYPHKSIGAPDARIHSFEDLEEEVDLRIVKAVNACVYDLPIMERNAVLMNFGLMRNQVWRADFVTLYDMAISALYVALRSRVAC